MTDINHKLLRSGSFPYVARYKDRYPDPGECKVLSINWEEERVDMSNGYCRYWPKFSEIDIYTDPKPLLELKKQFDEALAQISDEELHAQFDAIVAERTPVICPDGFRFLQDGEEVQLFDMYHEDGQWILHQGHPFAWSKLHDYEMIRKLV